MYHALALMALALLADAASAQRDGWRRNGNTVMDCGMSKAWAEGSGRTYSYMESLHAGGPTLISGGVFEGPRKNLEFVAKRYRAGIPAVSFPARLSKWQKAFFRAGDLVLLNVGPESKRVFAVIAQIEPGTIQIKLNRAAMRSIGYADTDAHGEGYIGLLAFPHSAKRISAAALDRTGLRVYKQWGGEEHLAACFKSAALEG